MALQLEPARCLPHTRLVAMRPQHQMLQVARHAQRLVEEGRSVLLVSAVHPAGFLLARLKELGVDVRRVFVMDASGGALPGPLDPEHAAAVANPGLLELITSRALRIIRSKAEGPPAVLVHSVEAFAAYNTAEQLEELVRYVVHSVARPQARIDFLADLSDPGACQVLAFLRGFVDEVVPAVDGVG